MMCPPVRPSKLLIELCIELNEKSKEYSNLIKKVEHSKNCDPELAIF